MPSNTHFLDRPERLGGEVELLSTAMPQLLQSLSPSSAWLQQLVRLIGISDSTFFGEIGKRNRRQFG